VVDHPHAKHDRACLTRNDEVETATVCPGRGVSVTRSDVVDAAVRLIAAIVGFFVTFALSALGLRHIWPAHHDGTDIGIAVASWGLCVIAGLIGAALAGLAARRITRRVRRGASG